MKYAKKKIEEQTCNNSKKVKKRINFVENKKSEIFENF